MSKKKTQVKEKSIEKKERKDFQLKMIKKRDLIHILLEYPEKRAKAMEQTNTYLKL